MLLEEGHEMIKGKRSLSFLDVLLAFLPEFHRQMRQFVLQNRPQHVMTIKVHLSASFPCIGVGGP